MQVCCRPRQAIRAEAAAATLVRLSMVTRAIDTGSHCLCAVSVALVKVS